jgi:lysophospholipase L1-like esterase
MIRRAVAHLGLVLLGLVLGLLLLEGGLRVVAFVARSRYGFESPASPTADIRILSLGDSNTFGLYVGKLHAYPQMLETRWNAHADRRSLDAFNAGYPGNTSWSILGQLGDLLAAYRPEVVTVMIGVNDSWRAREPHDDVSVDACIARAATPAGPPEPPRGTEWRLVRALRLLGPLLGMPLDHLEQGLFGNPRTQFDPAWPSDLLRNLGLIAACVRGAGARIVFLTYPSSTLFYPVANDALRMAALQARVPLIDLGRRFEERCPGSRCDYLFPDQHPTAAGHAWIADILVDTLPEVVSPGPASTTPD